MNKWRQIITWKITDGHKANWLAAYLEKVYETDQQKKVVVDTTYGLPPSVSEKPKTLQKKKERESKAKSNQQTDIIELTHFHSIYLSI